MNLSELNNINQEKAENIAKSNFSQNHKDNSNNTNDSNTTNNTNENHEDKHIIFTTHGLGAYGITVSEEDIDNLSVSSWVQELGVLMDYDETDSEQVSEYVLDALISYKLAKKKVILEVPFEKIYQLEKHENIQDENYITFKLDERYDIFMLLGLVANMKLNLSFLPPKEVYDTLENDLSVSDEVKEKIVAKSFDLYKNVLKDALIRFLEKENFDKFVFPITNYIEYLYSQIIYKTNEFIVTDAYILNFFANYLSDNEINQLKEEIAEKLYEYYGSKEEFENIAKILMNSVYNTMTEVSIENNSRLLEQKQAQS